MKKLKEGQRFKLRIYGKVFDGEIVAISRTAQDQICTVDFYRNGEYETSTKFSQTFFRNIGDLIEWEADE